MTFILEMIGEGWPQEAGHGGELPIPQLSEMQIGSSR
jgi:hypothetical protein